MNQELVDSIVNAVLYEGYILYPYRASAKKNRQRFTFGRVYPEAYSVAQNGAEPFVMQTECLYQRAFARPGSDCPPPASDGPRCWPPPLSREELVQGGPRVACRRQDPPILARSGGTRGARRKRSPSAPCYTKSGKFRFAFLRAGPSSISKTTRSRPAGLILRRQESAEGCVEIGAESVDTDVFKITVRILNQSPLPADCLNDQNAVLMRTFASTHTILRVEEGEFLSLIDPPADQAEAATSCKNVGTWPVLVGDEKKNDRDAMISSPIILYDYPRIAPESPGDLFDAAEIDEILSLRILTMTDEEKREMRHVDEHARRILERTESLPEEHFLKMHGVLRDVHPLDEDFFNPAARVQSVSVRGVELYPAPVSAFVHEAARTSWIWLWPEGSR